MPRRPAARSLRAVLLVVALVGFLPASVVAQPQYETLVVPDPQRMLGKKITFTGLVEEVRPTRNNDHLRIYASAGGLRQLIFIPSTTLKQSPDLWNIKPGMTVQFWGEGELFANEFELIVTPGDPSPALASAGTASPDPGAAPTPPPVIPPVAVGTNHDPTVRAASIDAEAIAFEKAYEERAAQLTSHGAVVEGDFEIKLVRETVTGHYRLAQQWTSPEWWYIEGTHEGALPHVPLGMEDGPVADWSAIQSRVVVGPQGAFGMYSYTEAPRSGGGPEPKTDQLLSAPDKWTRLMEGNASDSASWILLATGGLPLHRMLALVEPGTLRMDGTGIYLGKPTTYVRGVGRCLRDVPATAQRPDIRLGFFSDTLQPCSADVRGTAFVASQRVVQFAGNHAPPLSIFGMPVAGPPFVPWQNLPPRELIIAQSKLNPDTQLAREWKLIFLPGFSVLSK